MANILLIDDEDIVRDVMRRMLELLGHRVVEAGGGQEGLRRFALDPYDLVITDIIMPDQDGLETILEIKKNGPETRILAVSGGGRHIPARDCLVAAHALGAHRFLSKPITMADLRSAVGELVGNTEG